MQAVTFGLLEMGLAEEGYLKNVGEWAARAKGRWRQGKTEGRTAKKELDRTEARRVQLLKLPGRR